MPCSKASINKNYKCDKATCICIPTDGKPCICICENENGDITRCDDCKCNSSGACQCKCDDSKCTCIVTRGASCICVCRDEKGNLKSCNCSCFEVNEATSCCKKEISRKTCTCCGTKQEKSTRGNNCACGSENFQIQRRDVEVSKSYSNKSGCVCIPTSGKPCVCICENGNGDFIRCDDCKCRPDNCQCKCDDAKCTCIVTNGATCICVCRDEKGNIKTCDCSGTGLAEPKSCCKRGFSMNSHNCCNKRQEERTCDVYCKCDGKLTSQIQRRDVEVSKSYSNEGGCVCIPTSGKPCVCICENGNGDLIRCDDCKCRSDNCQCKCDDARCTCIVTNGASCICVCRDEMGNIKTCDCSTGLAESKPCCMKEVFERPCKCYDNKPEENNCRSYCCTVSARPAIFTCENSCIWPTKSSDCKFVDNKSYIRNSCICVFKRNTLIGHADNDDSSCTDNRKTRYSVCCDQDNLRRYTVESNECCTVKAPGIRCACFVSDGRCTSTCMPCYKSGTGSNKKTDGKCCGSCRN